MQDTEKKIFREKSLEQLSNPEQLNAYLKVTGPGVWFALVGIIILLAGMLVWGIFGTLITTLKVPAVVSGDSISCYVLEKDLNLSDDSVDIEIGDIHLTADPSQAAKTVMDSSAQPGLYESGYLQAGKTVWILTAQTDLQDGIYEAAVTTETLKPISLIFAKN